MARVPLNQTAAEISRFFGPIFLGCALAASSLLGASGDQEIAMLAEKLSRTLVSKGKAKVAVADFTDLEGRRTEFGRYLAEQLSVEMVNTPGMTVMDRANLKSILLEHKLSEDGLTNPETAKKLGQFANVDAIVLGTTTSLDEGIVVTIKAVSTDTAEIVAATKGLLPKTKDSMRSSMRGVGAEQGSVQTKTPDSLVVATKDFGDLRVTMKTIRRAEISGRPLRRKVTYLIRMASWQNASLTNSGPQEISPLMESRRSFSVRKE